MTRDFSEVPASELMRLASAMKVPTKTLSSTLGLNVAQLELKFEYGGKLTEAEADRMAGLQSIIRLVQGMVFEPDNPSDFDAAAWLGEWLYLRLPALGGRTAASYMSSGDGQKLIADLLRTTTTGAYV